MDHQQIADIIVKVSEEKILPRFGKLAEGDSECKGENPEDIVTIADKEAEHALKEEISKIYPDAYFIGEESCYQNPEELNKLSQDVPVWIIDPLDGTTNFKNGIAKFGVILSLVHQEEILHGWIYNPSSKVMTIAEKGAGAWSMGKKLSVAAGNNIKDMNAIISLQFFPEDQATEIKKRLDNTLHWSKNFGSVAIDYQSIVTSDIHFSVFNFIRVWDHAAGILLHAEAGGYAAKFDKTRYSPKDDDGGLLLAPSEYLWDAFSDEILRCKI